MLQWYQSTKAIGRVPAIRKLPGIGLVATKIKTRQPWQHTCHSVHISHCPELAAIKPSIKSDFINAYKNSLSFPPATCEIRDLQTRPFSDEEYVTLHGFLGARKDFSKNFYFVELWSRDLHCRVQVLSRASEGKNNNTVHDRLKLLKPYSPIVIKGFLKARASKHSSDHSAVETERVPSTDGNLKVAPPSTEEREFYDEAAESATAASHDLKIKKIGLPAVEYCGKELLVKRVEVLLHDFQSLNDFSKDIIITPETVFPPDQRHLQLRTDKALRDALDIRDRAIRTCRKHLSLFEGFTEVETPILFKSTREGAREFMVPTRRKGRAYALPQSPQQYKQILMASGISRYFQFARCFRDEDLRADRQPEFTQLDLEMSFATGNDVMNCVEKLIKFLWFQMLGIRLKRFEKLHYKKAIAQFGSDKPDLRLGMPLSRVGEFLPPDLIRKITPLAEPVVQGMILHVGENNVPPSSVRKFVGEFMDSTDGLAFNNNPDGAPGVFIYDKRMPLRGLQPFGFAAAEEIERRFEPQNGDIIVLQACKEIPTSGGSTPIGDFRIALHKAAVAAGLIAPPEGFVPLWVVDFPLFSTSSASEPGQGGAAGLASTHHPFTSPKTAKDVDLLFSDPAKVIGDHYDLVMNGVELGGGSRRIHNAEMQRFIMKDILKMSPQGIGEFEHLLEALRAGCPPHAGIALGFDRLIAVMLNKKSVRDVIAFPKSGKGEDLLVRSPGPITEEMLKLYHLRMEKDEEGSV